MNGDGNLDLVVTNSDQGEAADISLYFADSFGGFTLNSTFSIGDALVEDVNFADLNGDGILDMFASEGVDNILLGDGEGGFTPTQQSSGLGFGGLIAADLNQDGILDTVAAGEINFGIGREGLNPILEFSIATKADALQAISPLETKLKLLGQKQGQIGAFLSRLSSATNALEAQSLNSKEASNRILSADVAIESAALVRQQILQQSRTAILAQANQQYSIALSLLTPPLGSES